jgi:spore germination cell wall hydrolase CwlJ-like protein
MKDKTALEQAKNIAILSLAGARIDRMENVLYYHASYMRPYWISYVDRVEKIGTHIFYRSK